MIDWSSCPAVERDPARVSGAWVFRGTRVPFSALFENLEDDASLHEFIEWFPGVSTIDHVVQTQPLNRWVSFGGADYREFADSGLCPDTSPMPQPASNDLFLPLRAAR